MINKIIIYFALSLSLLSCGKDDFVHYEDAMFNRLSDGNGVWEVVSIIDYKINADGTTEVKEETKPDAQYVFYVHGDVELGMPIYQNKLAVLIKNSTGTIDVFTYNIWAEKTRITLYQDILVSDYVFTIEKNNSNKQIWQRFTVDYTTQETTKRVIELKKCSSCEPYYPVTVHSEI